jgi:hypothetical protein
MNVGDIVRAADPMTLEFKVGLIVEEVHGVDPFGMQVWKVLVNGKLQQHTDAGLRKVW